MNITLGRFVSWYARLGLILLGLAHGGQAQAWSATRLPEITIPGGGPISVQVDINRDGYRDLISTAPGTNHRGIVEVRYGSAKGFKQKADFHYEGPMDWAQVGYSPMAVDVNGDGWPDLVVGAYAYSGKLPYSGALLVFFGGPNGFASTPSQIIEGPESNSLFGFTARSVGDFNHDGYADIAVSADTEGNTKGKIFIYAGGPQGLSAQPVSTLTSGRGAAISWFNFGRVFDAGDLNRDGVSDIVVGAPAGQGRPGLVFIYKGSTTGYADEISELLIAPFVVNALDEYAASVSILGDVDGDGYPELAIGAPRYHPSGPVNSTMTISFGSIFVYYGSANGFNASGRMQTITPPDSDGFGFFGEVQLGRDFNGDGYADLIVGASARQRGLTGTLPFPGFVWLYTGGPDGFTKVPYKRSGMPGSLDGLGAILDAADVTGDGQMDIITSNPTATTAYPTGNVRVFRGARGLK